MIHHDPRENWTSFLFMSAFTFMTVFDFAWFREQFCIIMCPYGRFQSLLMDRNSLAVVYDEKRGEPRGKSNKGDCVDCFRCVAVCPTGIDIRRGVQMECVACTACIDACNEVMPKVNKPLNLIRYASVNEIEGRKRKILTPRVALYSFILVISIVGLIWAIISRTPVDITILRGHDKPFEMQNEQTVMNHFKMNLKNNQFDTKDIKYDVVSKDKIQVIFPIQELKLAPGEKKRFPFFVQFPLELTRSTGEYRFQIRFQSANGELDTLKEVVLLGPP
jgi:cytochrome c oxidase accessory protein FixG